MPIVPPSSPGPGAAGGPADGLPEHHEDHPHVISRNARRGLALFFLYFSWYVTFLLLNVFSPETMGQTSFTSREYSLGGLNLAIIFGISLILAAIFLSLLYMRMTRSPAPGPTRPPPR